MMQEKIIVAVAPVGQGIGPPAANPLTPEAIATEVIVCQRLGAAMVHLHVRDETGAPTGDLTAFARTPDLIRATSDIVIQGSTGGISSLSLKKLAVCWASPKGGEA